jgi:4-hydroxy-3-methylbut-2-enyl diphosphate reductase IspH
MNQSEFAALHGVSRKTVTKWKERGWLVFAGSVLDVEASNALIAKYRRDGIDVVTQAEAGNKTVSKKSGVTSAAAQVTIKPGETVEQATTRILIATGANMHIDEAKRVKENYLALREQLEYDREARLVVAVQDVTRAVGEEYARVRTRLLSIPSEHAPRIHRLKSVLEIQDALHGIIVEALEELTRDGNGISP